MCRASTGGSTRSVPAGKLALLALALGQMQRFDSGELTLAALSAEDFERADAEESYSEGIIDQLRAVQGTKVAALVRELTSGERKGQHKVSLRATDDDVDVSIDRARAGRRGTPPRGGLLDDARARGADRVPARARSPRSCTHPPTATHAAPHAVAWSGAAPEAGRARDGMDGILLIDKPAGMTSHDVVAAVRRALGGREDRARGHARPVRDRASDRAGRPRDEGAAHADGAAQALRDGRAARAPSRAPATPRGRSPTPAACPPDPPPLPTRRGAPAPAGLLGGEDRGRARLQARAPRRAASRCPSGSSPSTASSSSGATRRRPSTPGLQRAGFQIECGSGTYVRSLIADLGDAYCLELQAHRDRPVRGGATPSARRRRGAAVARSAADPRSTKRSARLPK